MDARLSAKVAPEVPIQADESGAASIHDPQLLPADPVRCERIALGEPDDYKPCVARMPDGELLLTAFHQHKRDGGKVMEQTLFFRSNDGGKSWDKTQNCEPQDFQSQYGFFGGETWLWQAKSGKIWALVRVDSNELPIRDRPIRAGNDQADHFILFSSADSAKTFDRIRDFGDYGEMYMSLLRLRDRRLLLTFTVRDLKPPLGVRSLAGTETDDGFEFDFAHDRVILDTKTGSRFQGGGFGPTAQFDDGTLVTSCSYRGEDDKSHLEIIRWKLPPNRTLRSGFERSSKNCDH
jgi:hypothetical protein